MEFNVADLLERVADTVPSHLALVCAQRRLSFADLEGRANRLAHVLQESTMQPTATRPPALKRVTAAPTRVTRPTISCPGTHG